MNDELDHVFGDDPDHVDEDVSAIEPEFDPAGSIPGGSSEFVALASHDANELLRFVESAMTEAESEAFITEVRADDPVAADRLLHMREDHRLLRTSLDLEPPPADLLGPVRARLARGDLVQVQSEINAEATDPTEFMSRSVASLARRRRRARRRPLAIAAVFGMVGVAVGIIVAPRIGNDLDVGASEPPAAVPTADASALASYGLVIPYRDRDRIELAMALVAAEHGAVLVRNSGADGQGVLTEFPPPIVGRVSSAPSAEIRADLGRRGFDYAVVVARDEVSTVLAEIGALADPGPEGRTSARLVASSSLDPTSALDDDDWESWSHQSEAAGDLAGEERRLVVPIAMVAAPGG